jgi:hypothetical protein
MDDLLEVEHSALGRQNEVVVYLGTAGEALRELAPDS